MGTNDLIDLLSVFINKTLFFSLVHQNSRFFYHRIPEIHIYSAKGIRPPTIHAWTAPREALQTTTTKNLGNHEEVGIGSWKTKIQRKIFPIPQRESAPREKHNRASQNRGTSGSTITVNRGAAGSVLDDGKVSNGSRRRIRSRRWRRRGEWEKVKRVGGADIYKDGGGLRDLLSFVYLISN